MEFRVAGRCSDGSSTHIPHLEHAKTLTDRFNSIQIAFQPSWSCDRYGVSIILIGKIRKIRIIDYLIDRYEFR